jgi:hypothetical protein
MMHRRGIHVNVPLCCWMMAKAEHPVLHNIPQKSPIKTLKIHIKNTFQCAQPHNVYVLAMWVRGSASLCLKLS